MIREQLDKMIDEKKNEGRIPILIHLTPDKFAEFIHEMNYFTFDAANIHPFLNHRGIRIIIGTNFVILMQNSQVHKYVKNGVLFGVVQLNQLLAQEFISFEE